MRRLHFAIVPALLFPSLAQAYFTTFSGWSKDGSYYVKTTAGTDGMESPVLCLTVPGKIPKTWPKGAPRPEEDDGCVGLGEEGGGASPEVIAKAQSWVGSGVNGPAGANVTFKKVGESGALTVTVPGKPPVYHQWDLIRGHYKLSIIGISWAPGLQAVAVTVAPPPAKGVEEGYGPPQEMEVIRLDAGAPLDSHVVAVEANRRGMKAYRAKDWSGAAKEFRAAIASDGEWVTPHYNLACVAALQHDVVATAEQLEWLQKSDSPDAKTRLKKAQTDPDLASARGEPKVVAILGAAPAGPDFARASGLVLTAWSDKVDPDAPAQLARLPEPHQTCEDGRTFSLTGELVAEHRGPGRVLVSWGEGIAVVDVGNRQLARVDLGDCEGAMNHLRGVGLAQLVPDEDPEIVVSATYGGRRNYTDTIFIYKRYGTKLEQIWTGDIWAEQADGAHPGKVAFLPDGSITYRAPGEKREKHYRWNAAKRAFTPSK